MNIRTSDGMAISVTGLVDANNYARDCGDAMIAAFRLVANGRPENAEYQISKAEKSFASLAHVMGYKITPVDRPDEVAASLRTMAALFDGMQS